MYIMKWHTLYSIKNTELVLQYESMSLRYLIWPIGTNMRTVLWRRRWFDEMQSTKSHRFNIPRWVNKGYCGQTCKNQSSLKFSREKLDRFKHMYLTTYCISTIGVIFTRTVKLRHDLKGVVQESEKYRGWSNLIQLI